ncbi:hypothetical protein JTB14_013801 [Gonioctena quinquepunctata]|nr:hypothetical protein JTB14_013801 [Gonioctena quinquepunctata]
MSGNYKENLGESKFSLTHFWTNVDTKGSENIFAADNQEVDQIEKKIKVENEDHFKYGVITEICPLNHVDNMDNLKVMMQRINLKLDSVSKNIYDSNKELVRTFLNKIDSSNINPSNPTNPCGINNLTLPPSVISIGQVLSIPAPPDNCLKSNLRNKPTVATSPMISKNDLEKAVNFAVSRTSSGTISATHIPKTSSKPAVLKGTGKVLTLSGVPVTQKKWLYVGRVSGTITSADGTQEEEEVSKDTVVNLINNQDNINNNKAIAVFQLSPHNLKLV